MRVDPEEASALCDALSGVLRYAASSVMPSPLLLQPTLAPAAGNRSGGRNRPAAPVHEQLIDDQRQFRAAPLAAGAERSTPPTMPSILKASGKSLFERVARPCSQGVRTCRGSEDLSPACRRSQAWRRRTKPSVAKPGPGLP